MSNNSIILESGNKVKWLKKDPDLFFQKMTLIYGGSGTGKSTILED